MTEADNTHPDTGPVSAFVPVPVRRRHDGWTPERQQAFIAALADTGTVVAAAARVGMSEESAYRLRRQPGSESFDQAWQAALAHVVDRLVDTAFSRALNGVATPVYHKGEIVGERRVYSDRLLMFLLKYHDPTKYGVLARVLPVQFADPRRSLKQRFAQWVRSSQADGPDAGKSPPASD